MSTDRLTVTLDREQLRQITMEDEDLMREVLEGLVEDTARQIGLLESAIEAHDPSACKRLAHYSRGACANVGARRAAELLGNIEREAEILKFVDCTASLAALARELELLRVAVGTLESQGPV